MEELQEGNELNNWNMIKSVSFGEIANNSAVIDIYVVNGTDLSFKQLNGILRFKEKKYLISDLSPSFIESGSNECPQICIFQHYFQNQDRYKIIGAIDISLNGPGLKKYFLYDETLSKLLTFDEWGEPGFIDLDNDGNEEFVIEFQGLHLSWPDLSIIREVNGTLEISSSVFNSISRRQGDFAILNKDTYPPTISISNVESDNNSVYSYLYHQGILKLVKEYD